LKTNDNEPKIISREFLQNIKQERKEEIFNTVLDALPFPFLVIDPQTYHITYSNQAGLGKGDTCHKRTHDRMSPCTGENHLCGLKIVQETGESHVSEHLHFDKNGNIQNVEVHNHPVFDEEGRVMSVIEYSIDITEKVSEKKRLNALVSELKAAYNVVPLLICLLDKNRKIRQVNQPFCDFFNLPVNEILGKSAFGDLGCLQDNEGLQECGSSEGCLRCSLLAAVEETFRTLSPQKDIEYNLTRFSGGVRNVFSFTGSTAIVRDQEENMVLVCLQDVTEKREEQDRLQTLTQAIEQSPVSVIITDTRGNIEFVNRQFTQVTGYTRHEALGQNPRILKSGNTSAREYQDLWDTITSGKEWRGVFHNKRKNGELYWESAVIAPILDSRAKITHYLAEKEDITLQKDLEERMRLFAQVIELGSSSIVICDAQKEDNPITYVNPAFEKMTGYTNEEVAGKNCRFLQGEDTNQPGLQAIRYGLKTGKECRALLRNYRKDGNPFWNEIRITPVKDERGTVTHFIGSSDDVTELRKMQGELIINEERLRLSQNFANIGSWDYNLKTGKVMASERTPPLFGYAERNIEVPFKNFLDVIHPEDKEKVVAAVGKCLTDESEYDVEHRCLWPDGTVHWLHENGNVVRDESGQPTHMLGVVQDITYRKEAEQALLVSREEARRANQAKSEFLSRMSHELRTPMNAIIGFSQLLHADSSLNEENQDSVSEIIKAGNHLLELINEVLDLSKIEAGKISLSLEPVFCKDIIEECMMLVTPLAQKHQVTVETDFTEGCLLHVDRIRLKQIILNLLSNGIKYNKPGGQVKIESTNSESWHTLKVIDTGIGIPEDKQDQIFQPFSRLGAEATEIEGTGIGLSIAKTLVEMMGGTLGFFSETGKGSVFTLTLPAGLSEDSPGKGQIISPSDGQKEKSTEGHRIFYMEDNPANLKLMERILSKKPGFNLVTSQDPVQGLELIQNDPPDLILLDINMPGMDGYTVLSKLKSLDSCRLIPVVAVTSRAMPHDRKEGLEAGFTEYLAKPLDMGQFFEVLGRLLGTNQ